MGRVEPNRRRRHDGRSHRQAAPVQSFWSRFFCRGAELMSPDVNVAADPDAPSCTKALSASEAAETSLDSAATLLNAALSRSPHTTDSSSTSDDENDCAGPGLPSHAQRQPTLLTPLHVPNRGSFDTLSRLTSPQGSPTQPMPRRGGFRSNNTSASQKQLSREHLYESIRAVRVPRCHRRVATSGSFSPLKVQMAVRADQRVLTVPTLGAAEAPTVTLCDAPQNASGQRESADIGAAGDPSSGGGHGPLLSSSHPEKVPLQSRTAPVPAFRVKDTRFFPLSPCVTENVRAHTGSAAGDPADFDSDPEEGRRLAQALTEKRLQQQQQKLQEEKRRREELAALRELEKAQRDAALKASQAKACRSAAAPCAVAPVLTEALLASHKQNVATAPVAAALSLPEESDGGDPAPLCDTQSLTTDSASSEGSAFEDDKAPGVHGEALLSVSTSRRNLTRIATSANVKVKEEAGEEEEDVTQCAMPVVGAGAARLVRAINADKRKPTADAARGERHASRYPLNSRAYVDRVILSDRRQQTLALLFLLDETHRFAWEWHLKLLQFYHYYFHPILSAVPDASARAVLEEALLMCGTGSVRKVHAQFYRDGQPVDYQQYKYEFEETWRKLFHAVRGYLDVPLRGKLDSVSVSGCADDEAARPSADSDISSEATVGFAATLLHSMELFQRQQETQSAAQEANDWTMWFYYVYLPAVQAGKPAPMPASSALRLDDKESSRAGVDTTSSRGDSGLSSDASTGPDVLPMAWQEAQNADLRSSVYWKRRQAKLHTIRRAERKLRQQRRAAKQRRTADTTTAEREETDKNAAAHASSTSSSSGCSRSSSACSSASSRDSEEVTGETSAVVDRRYRQPQSSLPPGCSPTELARAEETLQLTVLPSSTTLGHSDAVGRTTDRHHSRGGQGAAPSNEVTSGDGLSEVAAQAPEEGVDDYRVVNVGCFGFSFWSRADW